MGHCVWVLVRGVQRGREGARILLCGTFGLFVLFLHDILIAEHIIAGRT